MGGGKSGLEWKLPQMPGSFPIDFRLFIGN
jgi:hypothetical protein